MRKQINELLDKKMDRREFLKHLGLGTLVLFGLGSVLKLLNGTGTSTQKATAGGDSLAYGSSVYGGRKAK